MYTIDRSASPPPNNDRAANHLSNTSTSSSSTSSNRSGYKLFPTVELTPPPVRSRPSGPRRSISYDDGFTRPAHSDLSRVGKTLATRRGRKINLSLLKSKVASVAVSSPIPEVTITASSSPRNHTQLQIPIELGRSKSTGDETARPKTASLESRFAQQTYNKQTPQSEASSDVAVKTSGLDKHFPSSETDEAIGALVPSSPRSVHHTRQSPSLSTLDSDDVAYFGSAGLSTLSATKQCYSPVGIGLQVREVMVAGPPKDRQQNQQQQQRPKSAEPPYVMDGSDSDTCVPPPLFTSGKKRANAIRSGKVNGSSSNSSLGSSSSQKGNGAFAASGKQARTVLALPEQTQMPKSAPPTQTAYQHRPPTPTSQAVPAFIKFNSVQDLVEESPVPTLPQTITPASIDQSAVGVPERRTSSSNRKLRATQQDSEQRQKSPAEKPTSSTPVERATDSTKEHRPQTLRTKSAPQEQAALVSCPSKSASTDTITASNNVAPIQSPVTALNTPTTETARSSATTVRHSESKADPMRRLIDLTKQTDALYSRYEALRVQRAKQTASLAALVKEHKAAGEYADLLISQQATALNATTASMDVCVAKLKSAGAKKEKAMAALITSQGKQQQGVEKDDASKTTASAVDANEAVESTTSASKEVNPEKRKVAEDGSRRVSSTRRAKRSSVISPISPLSDDEAIVSVKVRRSRIKAEMMSKAAAGNSGVASSDTTAQAIGKPEGQVLVKRSPSPAPVELAAELPASLLARGAAQGTSSKNTDNEGQVASRGTVLGKRTVQHQQPVLAIQTREGSVNARRPPLQPSSVGKTASLPSTAAPPARTPPPPPPPPKTPPRQIKTSYFPQQPSRADTDKNSKQEKPDSAIALSSPVSTLGSGVGASGAATSSFGSSTGTSSSFSGSSVTSAGYSHSYSSSPSEDHEAKTPRYSDDEYHYVNLKHKQKNTPVKNINARYDSNQLRRVDDEDEDIPVVLLPPSQARTNKPQPKTPRALLLPQRNPERLAAKTNMEKLAIEQKEQQEVQVLSGEAEKFWEFCEGSFRLSRTPAGMFKGQG